jgi:hypothetical protein
MPAVGAMFRRPSSVTNRSKYNYLSKSPTTMTNPVIPTRGTSRSSLAHIKYTLPNRPKISSISIFELADTAMISINSEFRFYIVVKPKDCVLSIDNLPRK